MRGHQFFLFRRVHTGRSVVSLEEKPFPHIRVCSARGSIMLPVSELLKAARMPEGLSRTERKFIRILLEETRFLYDQS